MLEGVVERNALAAIAVQFKHGSPGCKRMGCGRIRAVVRDDDHLDLSRARRKNAAHAGGDQLLFVVRGNDGHQAQTACQARRFAGREGCGNRQNQQLQRERKGREEEDDAGESEDRVKDGRSFKCFRSSLSSLVRFRSCIKVNRMGQWISARDISTESRMRLFCLPHAGSGSAAFYRWKRLLPTWLDVCPVFLPGREIRLGEPSFERADELVDEMTEAVEPYLDKPFAIFGHSMGSLLSFELAHRLRDRGFGELRWLFLSGRIAAHIPPPHRSFHTLPEDEMLDKLAARYGPLPQSLLDEPDLRALFLPILRADLGVVESYQHREREPLACPVTVYAGSDDHSVSAEGLSAWKAQTRGPFAATRYPGDHFYHLGISGAEMVADMGRSLSTSA
jgi:medium-chain acyl-[acyl-carrier-protein] hydrolase